MSKKEQNCKIYLSRINSPQSHFGAAEDRIFGCHLYDMNKLGPFGTKYSYHVANRRYLVDLDK